MGSKRFSRLLDNLVRIRHFRGHGVHSPYVYNIVRNVFMHRGLIKSDNHALFDLLLKEGVDKSLAIELQNIATHCCYNRFMINPDCGFDEAHLIVCTERYPITVMQDLIASAKACGATIAVIAPKRDQCFEQIKQELCDNHHSTIIIKREYLLIFNNHLPRQRYIL